MKQETQYKTDYSEAAGSFQSYLFQDRRNKLLLTSAGIAIIIEFVVFKYYYPFASYIHGDSFNYLGTAYGNFSINTYMIGYPMFLRAFSVFTTSDTALVGFQYLLIQTSVIALLYTVFYFYRPNFTTQVLLLGFMVLNPLFLFIANLISSDPLFLALSIIWITMLLWIVHQPSKEMLIAHAFLLFYVFTIRYNALMYFFISIVAFSLSSYRLQTKIWSLLFTAFLIGIFIFHTSYKYKELTHTWQYSPFAGWQWANNAMYAYRYVDKAQRKPVPTEFSALDGRIRTYFDSTRDISKYPQEAMLASTFYMWADDMPLVQYRDSVFKNEPKASDLKKWASMAPLYKDYGLFLIKSYPGYFLRWYIWPNTMRYYAPPVEFLSSFNSGRDSVPPIARIWFRYPSKKIWTRTKHLDITMLDFYPILSGVINVLMLFGLISFLVLGGLQKDLTFRNGIFIGAFVWILNAGFTISASAAALRFQAFPIVLTIVFTTLLMDWISTLALEKSNIKAINTPRVSI